MDPNNLHYVPNDILIDILKLLSVRSLLRFKCVCKNWYDLIQNPSFAHTHLRSQKLQNKSRLFLQYVDDGTDDNNYALFPDETLASDAYHGLDSLKCDCSVVVVDGPVNGLFCLSTKQDFFIIWNPAIREFTTFSLPQDPPPDPTTRVASTIGFGADPSIDEYKVVLIRSTTYWLNDWVKDTRRSDDVSVHVYSLGTTTWRHLDSLDYLSRDYLLLVYRDGAYLRGVYYWSTCSAVLAFDMGDEVFRVISSPLLPQDCDTRGVKLYNDDRIALYHFIRSHEIQSDRLCEIWVMEEEGFWIKRFSVGVGLIPLMASLAGFWKDGELLFLQQVHDDFQLVLCNPYTQDLRCLGPKEDWSGYQALVYHESLVSVNGGIHQRTGKLSDSDELQYFFQEALAEFCRAVFSQSPVRPYNDDHIAL